MSENREEILANFQACTGIDDVAQAIMHLEESNWDLLSAVNRVMPQEHSFNSSDNPARIEDDDDVQMIDDDVILEPATDMTAVGNNVGTHKPQTSIAGSSQSRRTLRFSVHYQDRIIELEIPDTGTPGDLKTMLHIETGVPSCQQALSGWKSAVPADSSPLSSARLPQENALFMSALNAADGAGADAEQRVANHLGYTYTLTITDEDTKKEYKLKFPGTRSIHSIKQDVYTLTNIPVRHQVWNGWPQDSNDNMLLGVSGISYPSHELTVKKSLPKTVATIDLANDSSSASSAEEDAFEDASSSFNAEEDEDMFVDNVASKRPSPLIPERIDDEATGCIHFAEQFATRYGPAHPTFFAGALDDAAREAFSKPAKERRILALYLHHDRSVLANVFCTQLLGFESVVQILEASFILWGWDVTFDSNRARVLSSVGRVLGAPAAAALRAIPVEKLPAIAVAMRVRSSTDVYAIVHGNVGVNELLLRLVDAVDVFHSHQRVELREEEDRAARELVKWEQDQAYHESLEADRAKDEAKRLEAARESERKMRQESERAEQEAEKERKRKEVSATLPAEPPEGSGDGVTKIRFRLPSGGNLERRFLSDARLRVLLDYLLVEGYPPNDFKVISSWPRRDLVAEDGSKSLQQLGLCPQETVILEER